MDPHMAGSLSPGMGGGHVCSCHVPSHSPAGDDVTTRLPFSRSTVDNSCGKERQFQTGARDDGTVILAWKRTTPWQYVFFRFCCNSISFQRCNAVLPTRHPSWISLTTSLTTACSRDAVPFINSTSRHRPLRTSKGVRSQLSLSIRPSSTFSSLTPSLGKSSAFR